jgi:hypothetical protein
MGSKIFNKFGPMVDKHFTGIVERFYGYGEKAAENLVAGMAKKEKEVKPIKEKEV